MKTEPYENTIVCKGKLAFIKRRVWIEYSPYPESILENYEPVIISETENIEVGDYAFEMDIREMSITSISKEHLKSANNLSYKVLVVPENFSMEQLQDILDGNLKYGDEVIIECETKGYCQNGEKCNCSSENHKTCYIEQWQIKLNKDGHINVKNQFLESDWNEFWDFKSTNGTRRTEEVYNVPTKKKI